MEENTAPPTIPTPPVATEQVPPLNNPIPPASSMPKKKMSVGAIIGTILFFLIAGGAAAGFVYKDAIVKMVSKPTPTPTIAVSPTPTPPPAGGPTANWKTYTNEEYGFEVQYPPKTIVENDVVSAVILRSPTEPSFYTSISVSTLPKNTDLKTYLESKQYYTTDIQNVQIYKELIPYSTNTLNGYYYFGGFEVGSWQAFFNKENQVYRISYYGSTEYNDEEKIPSEFDQILSTFKFTQ